MMNTANSVYELRIIKKAIANHLDLTLPSDANQALYLIQYKIDDLVWNIAASIYSQSGYKVDFSLVRDLANARIDSLKILAAKEAEEARIQAEAEAKRKAKEEARKIEQVRREKEAEERRKAEEEKKEWIKEQRYKAEKEFTKTGKTYQCSGINQELFYKIKNLIVDQFEVEPDRVSPEACLTNDFGADENDMFELMLAVEEEFDIELTEDEFVQSSYLFSCEMKDRVNRTMTVEDLIYLVEKTTFGYY